MCSVCVSEQGAKLHLRENQLEVVYGGQAVNTIPIETIEDINIYGGVQLTEQCMVEFMKRGVPMAFYSLAGRYYGRIESAGHVQVERQRLQAQLYESRFAMEWSKKLIQAKIKNQLVVLQRYSRGQNIDLTEEKYILNQVLQKINSVTSYEQLMGMEGYAAKHYFEGLSKVVTPEFAFKGRSKQPPRDPFNAMLSLGYTLLSNEICGKISQKGLNPYFGMLHRDKENHPALASDFLEEWRAVIVDSTVLSLVNGHEIRREHFESDANGYGIYLTKEGRKIFFNKLQRKLNSQSRYLSYIGYEVSFRRAIELQVQQFIKAMLAENVDLYEPMMIR